MDWYFYVFGFLVLIILRFVNNFYKYLNIKSLYSKYKVFIMTGEPEFIQKKEEIKSLFKDAGIKDFELPHQVFLGYGQFANTTISGFDNMTYNREDIVGNMSIKFNEAIGVFKKRYKDSFNPMFWIDFLIKLPQYAFEFVGVLPEKVVVKIFQLIYWAVILILGLKQTNIIETL